MAKDTDDPGESSDMNGDEAASNHFVNFLSSAQGEVAAIAQMTESAKAAVSGIVELQKSLSRNLAEAQAKLAECGAVVTQALAAKTRITDEQAVIATKSEHIQKAQEHADKVRAELARALTSATQQVTEAEGLRSKAQSSADNAAALLASVQAAKGLADADIVKIVALQKSAEESVVVTKALAEKAATIEARVAAYEKRMSELDSQCTAKLKTIEGLLPGAASAGLASAFNDRRLTFLGPHTWWQVIFVASLLSIVVLTVTGLWHVIHAPNPPTYQEILVLWLARLPVAGALIWLAMHASQEAGLAKRLEEDYGYKAAISTCFEGFKKQMADINTGVTPDSALANLLRNTLTIIATPPGRIYEKHKLAVSPTEEFTKAAKSATELGRVIV